MDKKRWAESDKKGVFRWPGQESGEVGGPGAEKLIHLTVREDAKA
jgi:hypothetical protein